MQYYISRWSILLPWISTSDGHYINDKVILFLFDLIARKNHVVDSLVFYSLQDGLYNKEEGVYYFNRCFIPSDLELHPWNPRRHNTVNLDEEWSIFPVNVSSMHWVCLLRTTVYTSPCTQMIKVYYIDSINDHRYEDNVKNLFTGTAYYPHDKASFTCEWKRLYVMTQKENESGARTCLHACVMGDFLNSNVLNQETFPFVESILQDQLVDSIVEMAMDQSRTWLRQCLVLEELVSFEAVDMKYN